MAAEAMGARLLVVGWNAARLARVLDVLGDAGYEASGALSDDEAARLMHTAPDALVVGGGVPIEARTRLVATFGRRYPGRPIVEHVGSPAGLIALVNRALAS